MEGVFFWKKKKKKKKIWFGFHNSYLTSKDINKAYLSQNIETIYLIHPNYVVTSIYANINFSISEKNKTKKNKTEM